ncbi:MAG: hypothetical protein WCW67_03885 [Candidatus Margulisiibacteriota bacterium]|jgi:hypothetical protein
MLNVPTLAALGISLPNAVKEVRQLAQEIKAAFPAQNLRLFRPFLGNLKDTSALEAKGIDAAQYKALSEKKTRIINMTIALQTEANLSGLSDDLGREVKILRSAKTLLDIIKWASPDEAREVTVTPPGNPPYQVKIMPENTTLAMYARLDASPKVQPTEESTAKAEAEMQRGTLATDAVKTYCRINLGNQCTVRVPTPGGQRPFNFYLEAYGLDRSIPISGITAVKDLTHGFIGVVANPEKIYIGDYSGKATGPNTISLAATYTDRYIDLQAHLPIYQFIKTLAATYTEAAHTLHSSLSEIGMDIDVNTLKSYLEINTFAELFWMGTEDPWQDTGAASWYNTKEAPAFRETYRRYTQELGYAFGVKIDDKENKIYDISWRLASTKVSVTKQGLGPNAILIGDFLKAGEYDNGRLWRQYFPNLGRTEDSAARIALDPQLSVKAVALVFDAKARELKDTVFSNPAIRMPDDAYPTFRDPAKAREYFILSWIRFIKAFPEAVVNFPDFFPYGLNSWNIDFLLPYFKLHQAVMGEPDSFPEFTTRFHPSKGEPIADYFNPMTDPRNNDALMITVVPRD